MTDRGITINVEFARINSRELRIHCDHVAFLLQRRRRLIELLDLQQGDGGSDAVTVEKVKDNFTSPKTVTSPRSRGTSLTPKSASPAGRGGSTGNGRARTPVTSRTPRATTTGTTQRRTRPNTASPAAAVSTKCSNGVRREGVTSLLPWEQVRLCRPVGCEWTFRDSSP